jgi:sugar-specific transcriptional regulator TrmB
MNEKSERLLRQLGLTEYEARACLTLIRFGKCTAEKISSLGGIPLPRVYDTMSSLAKRGLVIISKTRPQTFRIINLKKFFKTLKEDEKRKMMKRIKDIDSISSEFLKLVSTIPRETYNIEKEDVFSFAYRRMNVEEIWNEIQNTTKREFLVFAGDLSWIDIRKRDIKKAIKKGIKYKIIFFKKVKNVLPNVRKALKTGVEIRCYDDYKNELRGIISDGKRVYLIKKVPKPGVNVKELKDGLHWSEDIADYSGVMLNSKLIAKAFRDYFYLLWEKAIPAENLLKELK